MTDDHEATIVAALERNDYDAATTAVVRHYGPEILGFLIVKLGDRTLADEAFSIFCEDLWKGLPGFAGRSRLRTWCYTVARNASLRHVDGAWQRRGRRLHTHEELAQVAHDVRQSTALHLRTSVKDEVAQLREQLDPADRELLVLRVDRQLSFKEIAVIVFGEQILGDRAAWSRSAATVRKRYQRATNQLRDRARDAGLVK